MRVVTATRTVTLIDRPIQPLSAVTAGAVIR
jgi:hypothetical protein